MISARFKDNGSKGAASKFNGTAAEGGVDHDLLVAFDGTDCPAESAAIPEFDVILCGQQGADSQEAEEVFESAIHG